MIGRQVPGPDSRVLCVIETIGLGGGAEQLLVDLAPQLKTRGIDVEIAALFAWPDSLKPDFEACGIKVHEMNFTSRWSIVSNLRALRTLTKAGNFRILWGHLYFGNLYARLVALTTPKRKSVATFHSEGYAKAKSRGYKARAYTILERALLTNGCSKVAVSNAVARDYESFFGWKDVQVAYNGVSTKTFPPALSIADRAIVRADFGNTDDDFVVVVPSRFVGKKGHSVLLDAMALLKRIHGWTPRVVAPGYGPRLEDLEAKAKSLGVSDRVKFCAPMPQPKLFALMQSADAVCIPSLREPFGLAAAESMGLGLPVLLTSTDGFLELVGDSESALMVPPNDAPALADALWTLYQQPDFRQRLGERARARIWGAFDISVCADRWVSVLTSVAQER